jgi:Domain of unknown function (DUF5753)
VAAEQSGQAQDSHVYEPWSTLLAVGEPQVQRGVGEEERAAHTLLNFQGGIVSGLLQTPEYARIVMADVHDFHGLPEADIDAAAAERIARQSILTEPGRVFRIVLTEGTLWSPMGRACFGQLTHLADVARNGIADADLRFGVIPCTARLSHAIRGFNVHEGEGFAWASEETVAGSLKITAPELVAEDRRVFTIATELAVYGEQAAAIIEAVRATRNPAE